MQAAKRRQTAGNIRISGYRVERLLAEGGMASVYVAEQRSLRRQVALKVLRKFDDPEQATRFVNEGRIIASLNHRNIITIHDIGRVGERHYLAMEYLDGGTLDRRIQAGMTPAEALDLLHAIASCLDFVHRRGIVHRDVKPSNILFHADGTPVLTDFGVAKDFGSNQTLTQDGSAVGSPYYLSPEQARSRPLDGRSDIYSLGVICFEMLTGSKPFRGESLVDTVLAHLKQPIPLLPPHLAPLQPLLNRMLAKKPDARFATAQELARDIERVRGAIDGAAPPPPSGPDAGDATATLKAIDAGATRSPHPRRRTLPVLLGLLLASAAGWWQLRDPLPTTIGMSNAISPAALPAPVEPAPPALPTIVAIPEPVERPPAPQPRKGDRLAALAERSLREYRLTTPPGNNARHFFDRLRRIDPGHPSLHGARRRIAESYADLAEGKLNRLDYEGAQIYLSRGLSIEPRNRRLKSLQQEASDIRRSQNLFYRAADALFN